MSETGRCCCDNVRMKSFFATLKKEKICRLQTKKMSIPQIGSMVFRNIYDQLHNGSKTASPGGLAPVMYRLAAKSLAA